jgi:hypothetical protein
MVQGSMSNDPLSPSLSRGEMGPFVKILCEETLGRMFTIWNGEEAADRLSM